MMDRKKAATASLKTFADVQMTVHADPGKVWKELTRISEWPKWNGALYAVEKDPLAPSTDYQFRLRGFGWAKVQVKLDDRTWTLHYMMKVKGNMEQGRISLCERLGGVTELRYQVDQIGWATPFLPLQNMAQWRMERLAQRCERIRT